MLTVIGCCNGSAPGLKSSWSTWDDPRIIMIMVIMSFDKSTSLLASRNKTPPAIEMLLSFRVQPAPSSTLDPKGCGIQTVGSSALKASLGVLGTVDSFFSEVQVPSLNAAKARTGCHTGCPSFPLPLVMVTGPTSTTTHRPKFKHTLSWEEKSGLMSAGRLLCGPSPPSFIPSP
ncbi:hypothetical protein M501DRAFT_557550 [Patellaria atrata CBS 101060]|uniref:Uncharacterized protein n=1 Tax=Patellaria atrata CBS 101060 TaxID=1346257 RepID=A0A9P4SGM8_9PEZI|nr:hypothetical protein M501DRAFT_557550 [Patellaria atrata CBS 101060]